LQNAKNDEAEMLWNHHQKLWHGRSSQKTTCQNERDKASFDKVKDITDRTSECALVRSLSMHATISRKFIRQSEFSRLRTHVPFVLRADLDCKFNPLARTLKAHPLTVQIATPPSAGTKTRPSVETLGKVSRLR
jgi:hypothetical protein